jgi:hypothetical protein
MMVDMLGKRRYKINFHTHTTRSDGRKTLAEATRVYREAGYDAIAVTDHWKFFESSEEKGLKLFSGLEYDMKNKTAPYGLFHIVGVGMKHDPELPRDATAQDAIDAIHRAGGLAILGHPAWSLNTPEQILALRDVDATEIYNADAQLHNLRGDSSVIIDQIGSLGRYYPLLATDDAHDYTEDSCDSWVMVEAEECSFDAIAEAVRAGRFYATQGPEVHLTREGDMLVVRCSPCSMISFFSNRASGKRLFRGENLTEASFPVRPNEPYVRVEVMDANGKRAWTNCFVAEEN